MSKKTEKKQQDKVIQDRTFGLKNKNKSKAVQKYVQSVAQTVKCQGMSQQKLIQDEYERKKAEKAKEEEDKLLASVYRTVDAVKQQQAEDEEELDPKSILCEYFKLGLCQKGKKCKYSHDMALEQKTQIIDLYTDQREQMGEDADSCLKWDEKTLKDVVEAHQKQYKMQTPTAIVCDYFLEALEKGKYGWRWVCPNGMTCHYRHCLPQGYVLKKQSDKDKREDIPIEDLIDRQREGLQGGGAGAQKVSKDIFLKWKEDRAIRKQQEAEKAQLEEQKRKGGAKNQQNNLTGRALFKYDPTLFVDDEEAAGEYERDEEEVQDDDSDQEQLKQYSDEEEQPQKVEIQQAE